MGNYEIIGKATNSIWDAMNCANRMVEVILNRDQCNITEN